MKKVYIKVCVNLQNMQETALFSGKIYTADKNFTQPSELSYILKVHMKLMKVILNLEI